MEREQQIRRNNKQTRRNNKQTNKQTNKKEQQTYEFRTVRVFKVLVDGKAIAPKGFLFE
jgi:hypothetical protein